MRAISASDRRAAGDRRGCRNAACRRAAAGLVDLHLMAQPSQMIGGGQAARPGADDQHALAGGGRGRASASPLPVPCRQGNARRRGSNGGVEFAAVASGLARVIADPAVHRRQRVVGHQRFPGRRYSPACARASQAWMFSPAGQAWLQGGSSVDVVREARAVRGRSRAGRQVDDRGQVVGVRRDRLGVSFMAGSNPCLTRISPARVSKSLTWINQESGAHGMLRSHVTTVDLPDAEPGPGPRR